jgi:phage shock protein A
MNFFKRLFKIGQAEAHSALDKLEDPIKLTEQGIRDLKQDLNKSLQAVAEVKALAIRAKNDVETYSEKAKDYERKAMLLLQKAQKGELDVAEAERLATEALARKEEQTVLLNQSQSNKENFEGKVAQLNKNVATIKSNISKWENELKTLKARVKVSEATKKLNKQMSNIDSTGTVSMLEKMKDKVAQEEALAESYGEIANESKSLDDDIEAAIGDSSQTKAASDLEALKAKMGLNNPE